MKCRICGNGRDNKPYSIREMMFGYKDTFQYFQCSDCQCLQIMEYPLNIAKYYSGDYYSYRNKKTSSNKIKNLLVNLRDSYALFGKGITGKILNIKHPHIFLQSLYPLHLTKNERILDIGCGNGDLLYSLHRLGFKKLLGIDSFIERDIAYETGLKILKIQINDIKGLWDVVMFHHSLEHIPSQLETLKTVFKILSPTGCCIIRIPIVSSYAWEHYGSNWVQIDAPRHFYLHSKKSIKILASKAGLELYKIIYDSTPLQFWGSEQYLNDIPLKDNRSYSSGLKNSIFSKKQIAIFTRKTKQLNENQKGDQAAFYLRKPI